MFFSTVDSSTWQSTLIIVRLSAQPFLGSASKAAAPPVCVLPRLALSAFHPLIFIFTRCISTPWIFYFSGFSAVSDMDNHSRDPLRSWGSFSLLMSLTFLEEALKWSENFLRRSGQAFHMKYLVFYSLFSGSAIYSLILRWYLWYIICTKVLPNSRGFTKLSEGLLRDFERRPEKFDSYLLLFLSRDKEGFNGVLHFSTSGFWVQLSLLIFFEEEIIKIEVIE